MTRHIEVATRKTVSREVIAARVFSELPDPETAVELVAGKAAFSIDEFCQAFGVKRGLAYEEIKEGRLKVRKAGRRTLIRAVDARQWLDSLPGLT